MDDFLKIAVFDDMSQCSEREVERLLTQVSAQRRETALAYKHVTGQFACLKSYTMLKALLRSQFGNDQDVDFVYNAYGKPSLKNFAYPVDFSISHCKSAIVVGIASCPIGIDVEHYRRPSAALIEKTMSSEEAALIAQAQQSDLAFTALWTRKEALLKYQGTGIVDDLPKVLRPTDKNLSCDLRTYWASPSQNVDLRIIQIDKEKHGLPLPFVAIDNLVCATSAPRENISPTPFQAGDTSYVLTICRKSAE